MRRKILGFVFAAALLAALALPLFGCSDSADTLTLDEYFAEFEVIDADVDAQVDALYVDFPVGTDEEISSDDATVPFFKDLVAGFQVALSDGVERMNSLEPPSEVKDEHDALIEAGEDAVAAFADGGEVIKDVQKMAEFETLFPEVELDLNAVEAAFETACLDLAAAGEANGVTVNVDCEDDE